MRRNCRHSMQSVNRWGGSSGAPATPSRAWSQNRASTPTSLAPTAGRSRPKAQSGPCCRANFRLARSRATCPIMSFIGQDYYVPLAKPERFADDWQSVYRDSPTIRTETPELLALAAAYAWLLRLGASRRSQLHCPGLQFNGQLGSVPSSPQGAGIAVCGATLLRGIPA